MVARDLALVELTGGRAPLAHLSTARRACARSARRSGAACRVTARGDAAPPHAHRRGRGALALRHLAQDEPAAPLGGGRGRAARGPRRRHHRLHRHRPRAALGGGEGPRVRRGRERHRRAGDRVPRLPRAGAGGRPHASRALVEALTAGAGARRSGCRAARSRAARRPTSRVLDPGPSGGATRARFHSKSRNTPWKGKALAGRCTHDLRGRAARARARRGRDDEACDPGARGRHRLRGQRLRRRRRGHGRGGLQHLDDRLPGDPDRPVLRRADGLHDLPGAGELRRERRATRSRRARTPPGFIVRHCAGAPSQLARRAEPRRVPRAARHRRHRRPRHAHAHPPPAHARARRWASSRARARRRGARRARAPRSRAWRGRTSRTRSSRTKESYVWTEGGADACAGGEPGDAAGAAASTSSRTTAASSAPCCGSLSTGLPGDGRAGATPAEESWRSGPTASSSPTARAIRRR